MGRLEGIRQTHVLAYVGIRDEELRAQVFFCDGLMIGQCDGCDAGEDQVFGDFVGEGSDGDEEDVCGADPARALEAGHWGTEAASSLLLGLHSPQADLAVIEGYFICVDVLEMM